MKNELLKLGTEDPTGSTINKVVIERYNFPKHKRNWLDIVAYVLGIAGSRGYTRQQIKDKFSALRIDAVNRSTDWEWRYVESAKLSVYNVEAKAAIPVIRALRDELKISAMVEFTLKDGEDKRSV